MEKTGFSAMPRATMEYGSDGEQPKKRPRRSRKGLEKTFACEEPGCDKRFTRAEHLSRHQLNHRPKEIFPCQFPGCTKTFVRADLRARHAQRHEKGDAGYGVKMEDDQGVTQPLSGGPGMGGGPEVGVAPGGVPIGGGPGLSPLPVPGLGPPMGHIPTTNMASVNNPPIPSLGFLPPQLIAQQPLGQQPIGQPLGLSPNGPPSISNNNSMPQVPPQVPPQGPPGMASYLPVNSPSSGIDMDNTLPPLNNNTLLVNALDMDMRSKLHSTRSLPKPWQPDEIPSPRPMFSFDQMTDYDLNAESSQLLSWLFGDSSSLSEQFDSPSSQATFSPPSPMAEDFSISEEKQKELIGVIPSIADDPSIANLSKYLLRFWDVINAQIDVIHRGTFRVNSSPPGLLWSMILMGAGLDGNQTFANKISHPLRWILFASPDCQPPAKLWVFQALMLLECYEKMYTDRILHERGHVHHATTIQLMRRSSVFMGTIDDHFDYYDSADSRETAYEQRVKVESFKRIAYLAFCLDVLHSVTFGHTPSVSAHEIRLQLPDEQLWNSSESSENNGDRPDGVGTPLTPSRGKPRPPGLGKPPPTFLSALKRVLNKQHVDVKPFGRHVLLFGLMSVAIQMQQRDLQASSIGWKSRKPWKEILSRSYDFWAHEYGLAYTCGPLPHLHPRMDIGNLGLSIGEFPSEFLNAFSLTLPQQQQALSDALSLSALHIYHLGSIVLHLSPHDFQIFAGVPRMLTVKMRQAQYDATNARMHEWARTEPGSIAVWHAIRILRDVFLDGPNELTYRGDLDPVIQRPHSVTMAALALWAFVFVNSGCEDHAMALYKDPNVRLTAEKGKITEWGSEMLTRSEERPINSYVPKEDGYEYLKRLSGLSPVEIRTAPNLQNIIGLLQVVWKAIEKVRWEILQELSRLLQHCMERSRGKQQQKCDFMVVWRSR
ncbi:Zinc finger protein [Yarrowia sp. E02]|nr:Zinc finger protein [Yarrowia sp. E02]